MVKRNPKNRLERWEVALVKAMLAEGNHPARAVFPTA